jgi:hypothetical protein
MANEVEIIVAVGAEGISELKEGDGSYPPWVREATPDEVQMWCNIAKIPLLDADNRPYFIVAVNSRAPAQVWYKASRHYRVKRLID